MHPLDIGILVLVGFVAIRGLRRGFVRGVLDLVVWLAALVVASRLAPWVATWLTNTAFAPVAATSAFSITFVAALVAGGIASSVLLRTVSFLPRIAPFSFLNSVLGIAPGVIKGAMLASVVLAPLLAFEGVLGNPSPLEGSVLARPLVSTVDRITNGAFARAGIDPASIPGSSAP